MFDPIHIFRKHGFTLIEVVIAVGIFGFCIVVIIGLLSSMLDVSRESWMETRAAHIARQIAQDLAPNPDADTNIITGQATGDTGVVITNNTTNAAQNGMQISLLPATPTNATVYYTSEEVATNQPSALFRADITVSAFTSETVMVSGSTTSRQVSQLQIKVYPIGQTNSIFQFFSRITPQISDQP